MTTRLCVLLAAMMVATLAGCEDPGSQQSAGDVGSVSHFNDSSPKADWATDGAYDGTDGLVGNDGTVEGGTLEGTDSTDATDGSDATESSDSTDASDGIVDCSVPPEDCGLYDGQPKICTEITGQPEQVWVFWNAADCGWELNTESWSNPTRVVVTGIAAHDPGPYMEAYACEDPPTEATP